MEFVAGYSYVARPGSIARPPLVLLHGSGRTEEDWLEFADIASPDMSVFRVRGPINWEDGFAFFRRNPDRTLDSNDLQQQTGNLARFIAALSERYAFSLPPVIIGFSNGAIIAASLIAGHHALVSGAVLIRPLSPNRDTIEKLPDGYPMLILAARHDERRAPHDHEVISREFAAAGADVTHRLLDCGHVMGEQDMIEAKAWLAEKFP